MLFMPSSWNTSSHKLKLFFNARTDQNETQYVYLLYDAHMDVLYTQQQ